ncbi:hypothetical protein HAZT_HAZT007117 [Hyalella azteca]|uniref:ditrans,polycis-polyprenyl diphosphate synthase [(2E,6E)-farnesyldiphosphate specific] n=1 Tax=Hyalella azteca TaxID=294128 RepID=A0A6A0H183_HYAAZ|nr:hypothetical protein HAZT_HAZT007117 [Hyalella azteca]
MDGNRRYAKLHEQETFHGHIAGFKTLTYVLAWCRDLGITEVTSYALSIENFKRSKEEVEGLLSLASNKFEEVLNEGENLAKHAVRECAIAISEGRLQETDITPRLLEQCLYTAQSCHPDLVLWPELSIWHVLGAVFHYQRHHHTVVAARKQAKLLYDRYELEADQACSLDDPVSV